MEKPHVGSRRLTSRCSRRPRLVVTCCLLPIRWSDHTMHAIRPRTHRETRRPPPVISGAHGAPRVDFDRTAGASCVDPICLPTSSCRSASSLRRWPARGAWGAGPGERRHRRAEAAAVRRRRGALPARGRGARHARSSRRRSLSRPRRHAAGATPPGRRRPAIARPRGRRSPPTSCARASGPAACRTSACTRWPPPGASREFLVVLPGAQTALRFKSRSRHSRGAGTKPECWKKRIRSP